ncbi:hypothetical protein L2E82_02841 [Cichorium intybus]|uniref:Uncharacterized protein n=1 Tax=Cichorium intybus TaxID=13427 RepID=A0ACB9H2F2_CICIN|nr:hypothetical protein L2E82_02841 [Cichorium intybus]
MKPSSILTLKINAARSMIAIVNSPSYSSLVADEPPLLQSLDPSSTRQLCSSLVAGSPTYIKRYTHLHHIWHPHVWMIVVITHLVAFVAEVDLNHQPLTGHWKLSSSLFPGNFSLNTISSVFYLPSSNSTLCEKNYFKKCSLLTNWTFTVTTYFQPHTEKAQANNVGFQPAM